MNKAEGVISLFSPVERIGTLNKSYTWNSWFLLDENSLKRMSVMSLVSTAACSVALLASFSCFCFYLNFLAAFLLSFSTGYFCSASFWTGLAGSDKEFFLGEEITVSGNSENCVWMLLSSDFN